MRDKVSTVGAQDEAKAATASTTDAKYAVLAELGRGGMATAYLAAMQGPGGFNKLVVVKRLRPALAAEQDFLKMFLEEARLAARLEHPNVVHTTEVGFDGKHHYIAMEYLEGQALESIFRRLNKLRKESLGGDSPDELSGESELPLKFHLYIISQALLGLDCAHELRDFDGSPLHVVHRDVSPHNIVVTYDGHVKLLDFGIAKAADSSGDTRTGVLKGKCAYMPAEQFGGKAIDRRADIFAVGVILWQALTGRRLWRGLSDAEIFQKVAQGHIASPRAVRDTVPEELDAICMKALALRAEDRFATAVEFQTAIDDYVAAHPELRTSSRELGKFVAEKFAADRSKLKSIVESQLGKGASVRSVEVVANTSSPPSAVSATSEVNAAITIPPSKNRIALFGGVAATAVAALVAVGVTKGRDGARAAAAQSTSPLPATPASNGASAESTRLTSVVRAHASPDAATLTFDGAPIDGNPSVSTFRRDGINHKVEASAPGFATHAEWVTLDRPDVTIEIALQPNATATAGAAAARSTTSRTPSRVNATVAIATAPPDKPTTAAVTPPPATPSASAPPTTPQGPKLDKGDPWAPSGGH